MNTRPHTPTASLLVSLALPALLVAQDHPDRHFRYILKDLGTLGGPSSFVANTPDPMNGEGVVVGIADTPDPDPFDPFCVTDCYVAHTFQWRKGILTDLGSLAEGASSGPNGINKVGVIAGLSENGMIDPQSEFPPEYRAVVWKDGQIIDLGTLGGTFSYANALNDRSQVVGFALNGVPDPFVLSECGDGALAPTQRRAFLWQEESGLQELGTLGGPDSCGMFINKHGQVAGNSFTSFTPNPTTGVPTQDVFFWKDGTMTDLGSLGGTLSHVSAMNDRGQICGDSDLEGDETQHGFFWDRGVMTDLTPDRFWSVAEAVNDKGEVVGGAFTPDGRAFEGYLWRRGVLTNLATSDGCGSAQSINANGQIVGNSFLCTGEGLPHAVLWEHGGVAIDLNTAIPVGSLLTLTSGWSISDAGEITGQAVLANGEEHAYLLIPGDRRPYDDGANSSAVTQPEAEAAVGREIAAREGRPTAEMMAAWRTRLSHPHRALGSNLSK